jgi:hypothetical protein
MKFIFMVVFLAFALIGSHIFAGTLDSNFVLPEKTGANEVRQKLVLHFQTPYSIPASQIASNPELFQPEEVSGYLTFQNARWIPQSRVDVTKPFCRLIVFSWPEGHPADITLSRNLVVFDTYYTKLRWKNSGDENFQGMVTASLMINRWTQSTETGGPEIFLADREDDIVYSIEVTKNYSGAEVPDQSEMKITAGELKSCFGAGNLELQDVPATLAVE